MLDQSRWAEAISAIKPYRMKGTDRIKTADIMTRPATCIAVERGFTPVFAGYGRVNARADAGARTA